MSRGKDRRRGQYLFKIEAGKNSGTFRESSENVSAKAVYTCQGDAYKF